MVKLIQHPLFDDSEEKLVAAPPWPGEAGGLHESPLLTAEEAAAYLRIPLKLLHRLVRQKRITCLEYSKKNRRFKTEWLDEFINRNHTSPLPKSLDSKPPQGLTSLPKGGNAEISDRAQTFKKLREETRSWQ